MRSPIEGPSSRSRLLAARLGAALCVLAALGCEDEAAPPVIPPLAELSLLAPGEATGSPCVQRGDDARQSIVAQVRERHFALQPPLSCGIHECGTVRFTLETGNREFVVESAQRFTSISTLELPDGRYTITASLLDTLGKPYKSRDDKKPKKCPDCTRTFTLGDQCQPTEPSTPEPSTPEPSMPSTEMPDAGTMTPQIPVEVDAGAPQLDAAAPLFDAGTLPDAATPSNDPDAAPLLDAGNESSLDAATPSTDSGATPSPDATASDAG